MYDVLIIGGGPAGLSAALWLGRCCRRVLVCDEGRPRNAATRATHGFLTRDGVAPDELRAFARAELAPYDVELREVRVTELRRVPEGFEAALSSGERVRGRKAILATGVEDVLPEVEGIDTFYGNSAFHCPYCDGWEWRGQPIAIYAEGAEGAEYALGLTTWSRDLVLFLDGGRRPPEPDLARLARHGVTVRPERVRRLEGADGQLERVVLASGEAVSRRVLFFHLGRTQRSDLAARLGCKLTRGGTVKRTERQGTGVPGLYVAGDACRDVNFLVVAAAEGAKAAFAINRELREEDTA